MKKLGISLEKPNLVSKMSIIHFCITHRMNPAKVRVFISTFCLESERDGEMAKKIESSRRRDCF
jgi:hypothetical protein